MEPNPGRPRSSRFKLLKRGLKFAFPYKGAVIGLFFITLAVAVINAAEPLILKKIFDNLEKAKLQEVLIWGVAWLACLGILREIAAGFSNWLTWHTRLGLHYALLEATVERLHRLPLSFHRSEGVGAIMTKLDRSIQGFINAASQILFNVFPALLYLIISIVIMIRLEWKLALLVLAFSPLPALIAAMAAPEQTRRERILMNQWSKIYSRFNEVLSGIVTVRSFAMEDMEKKRFLKEVGEANRVVVEGVGTDTGFSAASNIVIAAARIAATGYGGYLVLQNEITLGTLVAFLGYVGGLFGPVQGLSGIYQTIQKASVSLEELFSILDFQESLGDAPDAIELNGVKGHVIFQNLKFRYENRNRPLLNGINLDVKSGETIAIVGPSGSGKSTLMALLMRFYDPVEGSITLDGVDLRKIKQKSLRQNIGVVLQDPLLFNDTIQNNIAYGLPSATMAQISEVAKLANAHDFISHLPDQYQTMVGERGSNLSLGERQRVTIARALIKNPPIIIMDEATASLDAESEALVQEALDKLMKGRTTFVIAHRLSTVVHADRIIVLKEGLIAESGTHRELMRLNGYYASLVKRQTRGLIRNEGEEHATPVWGIPDTVQYPDARPMNA
ncbi:MAG: ABC transporter ATP-binding protein [Verrucomicrobiales bacterium]